MCVYCISWVPVCKCVISGPYCISMTTWFWCWFPSWHFPIWGASWIALPLLQSACHMKKGVAGGGLERGVRRGCMGGGGQYEESNGRLVWLSSVVAVETKQMNCAMDSKRLETSACQQPLHLSSSPPPSSRIPPSPSLLSFCLTSWKKRAWQQCSAWAKH